MVVCPFLAFFFFGLPVGLVGDGGRPAFLMFAIDS
jgi:hypothetical protein